MMAPIWVKLPVTGLAFEVWHGLRDSWDIQQWGLCEGCNQCKLFKTMLTCDLRGSGGRPPAVTLSISPHPARSRWCSRARGPGAFVDRACLALGLTYILPSTISSVEICVNQPPLWLACPLPPPGWLSRSADLITTEETISSDFHFHEPPPPLHTPDPSPFPPSLMKEWVT